jgi:hypothetical protein
VTVHSPAFTVKQPVLFIRELRVEQPVGSIELDFASDIYFSRFFENVIHKQPYICFIVLRLAACATMEDIVNYCSDQPRLVIISCRLSEKYAGLTFSLLTQRYRKRSAGYETINGSLLFLVKLKRGARVGGVSVLPLG